MHLNQNGYRKDVEYLSDKLARLSGQNLDVKMEYTISGVKVKFPYKPYPSQFTMMDKASFCFESKYVLIIYIYN